MKYWRQRKRMEFLFDAGTAAVHVVEVPVARREAEPLRHLVVAEDVEAQPVSVLEGARRLPDWNTDLARAHALLASVNELACEHEAAGRLPYGVDVDDPARIAIDAVLLGPPGGGTDAEVHDVVLSERREANPAAVGLVPVVVIERVVGRLVLPAVHDPGLRVERRAEPVAREIQAARARQRLRPARERRYDVGPRAGVGWRRHAAGAPGAADLGVAKPDGMQKTFAGMDRLPARHGRRLLGRERPGRR